MDSTSVAREVQRLRREQFSEMEKQVKHLSSSFASELDKIAKKMAQPRASSATGRALTRTNIRDLHVELGKLVPALKALQDELKKKPDPVNVKYTNKKGAEVERIYELTAKGMGKWTTMVDRAGTELASLNTQFNSLDSFLKKMTKEEYKETQSAFRRVEREFKGKDIKDPKERALRMRLAKMRAVGVTGGDEYMGVLREFTDILKEKMELQKQELIAQKAAADESARLARQQMYGPQAQKMLKMMEDNNSKMGKFLLFSMFLMSKQRKDKIKDTLTDLAAGKSVSGGLAGFLKGIILLTTSLKVVGTLFLAAGGMVALAVNRIRVSSAKAFEEGFHLSHINRMRGDTEAIRSRLNSKEFGLKGVGMNISPEEIIAMEVALSTSLGGREKITDNIRISTARIHKMWGASAEEASEFVSKLRAIGSMTDAQLQSTIEYVESVANTAEISTLDLMETISNSSEEFYSYARDGGREFIRSAAALKRARIDVQAMSGVATGMVSSFEGFLENQAKLQTMFPGLDLTEVMMASQWGSLDDVASTLQSALLGAGIDDISSFGLAQRNDLSQTLGLSFDQLTRVLEADFDGKLDGKLNPSMDPVAQNTRNIMESNDAIRKILNRFAEHWAKFITGPISRRLAGDVSPDEARKHRNRLCHKFDHHL